MSFSLFTMSQMGFNRGPPTPSTQLAPISTDKPAKFIFWIRPPILFVASSINIFSIPAFDNLFAADIPTLKGEKDQLMADGVNVGGASGVN